MALHFHFYNSNLANMFNLASTLRSRSEVTNDGPVEQFHHHAEQAAGEGGVPSAFGAVVPDEGVLRLDFHELWEQRCKGLSKGRPCRGLTVKAMSRSSIDFRIRSRPSLGTWVS